MYIALYDGQGYDDRYEFLKNEKELEEHRVETREFFSEDRWSYYEVGKRV